MRRTARVIRLAVGKLIGFVPKTVAGRGDWFD
jgi:hypothetical protein